MKSPFYKFIKLNLSTLLWTGFILLLCGLPGSEFPDMSKWRLFSFDKLIHFMLFMILVLITIKNLKTQYIYQKLRYNAIKTALAWAVVLGIFTELLQEFVFSGRNGDVYDVIANITGAFSGVLAFYIIYGRPRSYRFG